jgi:hypothetical protein
MAFYPNGGSFTLSRSHQEMLYGGSGIAPGVAAERGYYTARRRSEVPEAFKDYQRKRGLVVPVFSPDMITRSWQLPRMLEEVRCGSRELWITEGIKKADALTSRGLPTIGLIGVWNWQIDGNLLPCWEHVRLKGRRVYIVFDSDVMVKEGVQLALERLVRALENRGAEVLVVYLPEEEVCYA